MIQNLTIEKLQALCLTVQQCFPHSDVAICGGAPRDILNGKPVKDIDVFIRNESSVAGWFDYCNDLARVLHCDWVGKEQDAVDRAGYAYGAFRLVDYPTGLHMHPVQLVFINEHPVENVARHFDFGLSQVWVTPNQLRMTRAYWHDHFHKRITYIASDEPNAQRRQSSRERLIRLQEKYAGWRFERTGALAWDDVLDAPRPVVEVSAEDAPKAEPVHTFDPGSMVSRPMTFDEHMAKAAAADPKTAGLVVGGIYRVLYEGMDDDFSRFRKWLGSAWTNGSADVHVVQHRTEPASNIYKVRSVLERVA